MKRKFLNNYNISIVLVLLVLVFGSTGCQEYTPKPHGYPKIEFPERNYVTFDDDCSYTFEVPSYSTVERDTHFMAEPCWYNIKFPSFNATVYVSYKTFSTIEQLDTFSEDAFRLAGEHRKIADQIEETEIHVAKTNSHGLIFELLGPSATPFNFYISDEKKHFVRGSFYFDNHTKVDSVAPVYEFLKKDMIHMINSIEWKN